MTRLKDGLDDQSYTIAMVILAEAAVENVFTSDRKAFPRTDVFEVAGRCIRGRIADVLEILVHDGYLETGRTKVIALLRDCSKTGGRPDTVITTFPHPEPPCLTTIKGSFVNDTCRSKPVRRSGRPIRKFNPGTFQSDEEVIEQFVVRIARELDDCA